MTNTHKVRTKFHPDREIEVGDAELLDLKRQGLLVEDKPKPQATAQQTNEATRNSVSGADKATTKEGGK